MKPKNSWTLQRPRANLTAALAAVATTVLLMVGLDALAEQSRAQQAQAAAHGGTISA